MDYTVSDVESTSNPEMSVFASIVVLEEDYKCRKSMKKHLQ